MKNINRKRALLISGAVILLCFTIIVGMTWALFTDMERVTNHLQAGTLDITLERIALTKTAPDYRGYMFTTVYETEKAYANFTNATNENVFDITEEDRIVPLSEFTAGMRITNNSKLAKSDVAFAYWVEVVYTGDVDAILAEQIQISIDNGKSQTLNQGYNLGSEKEPIGVIGLNESATFTVSIKFLDLKNEVNDLAQESEVSFDLIVHAVQYTGNAPIPQP